MVWCFLRQHPAYYDRIHGKVGKHHGTNTHCHLSGAIKVQWPSGKVQVLNKITGNQAHRIEEPR